MNKKRKNNRTMRNARILFGLAFLCIVVAVICKVAEVAVNNGEGQTDIPAAAPTDPVAITSSAAPAEITTAPTDTLTGTPTDTPTDTPTNTPTPVSEEMAELLAQHEEKLTSAAYTDMYSTFTSDTYGFPVISITTYDDTPVYKSQETVACIVDTFNCSDDQKISESARIRVRGNSSAAPVSGSPSDTSRSNYPNESYPYKIKFDTKQNLFGLNSGNTFKDWVLLETSSGRPYDNLYAFRLAAALNGGRYYASDGCLVHVYLNGTYMGLYTLCEQSEVKKNRVNVKEPDEGYNGTDIGYFLEIDNYAGPDDDTTLYINHHNNATVTDIQGRTRTFQTRFYTIHSEYTCDEQKTFIKDYINNVFNIVYEAVENEKYYAFDENWNLVDASDTYTGAKDCIGAVLDLDSVVISYLIEEITQDYDRGEGSFYMAVDFSEDALYKKLTFLCPWDFEWGYFYPSKYTGNEYELLAGGFDDLFGGNLEERANYWFILLMKEDWFRDMVCTKWVEFYAGGAYDSLDADLTSYAELGANDITLANKMAKSNTVQKIAWLNSYTSLVSLCDTRIKWLNDNWFCPSL